MKTTRTTALLALCIFLAACGKEPGIGGDATIQGLVWIRDYNSTFTELIGEYPAADQYVYIKYGHHHGYDNRVKTDYDGKFEFDHLYEGDYEVYVYSNDSTLTEPSGIVPVIVNVSISERRQLVDLGTITIFD